MASYTNIFGSDFPNTVMERKEFKNVDETVLPYITAYFNAMMSEDFEEAQRILNESVDTEGNPIDLIQYRIDAFIFNWLVEEIRNAQIYALAEKQIITYVDSISELPDKPIEGHIYRVKR